MRQWLLAVAMWPTLACAAEGMWTLDNLPAAQIKQQYGFSPDAAWVDKVMHASARIANGCSASFVSPNGLVLSNHHCAVSCVEQLSTARQDFVELGFLAHDLAHEVRCPEIEINRLEKITDVTQQVKAATQGLDGNAFKKAQDAVKAQLTQACVGTAKDTQRCDVVDLYHGGQYHLYQYHRFQDVRLVFVPEAAIGFFGGDPDNFNFPRYALDMSVMRVYENGKPAQARDYFPLSADGAKAGELTFVTGHPGTTRRLLTMAQLANLRDIRLQHRLLELAGERGMLRQYSTEGAEQARVAHTDLFYIENSYKAMFGQLQALQDPKVMAQKQQDEASLRAFVAATPALKDKAGGAWDAIARAQTVYTQIEPDYVVKEMGGGFDSEYFDIARTLVRGAAERAKPNTERLREFHESDLPQREQKLFSSAPIYPDFEKTKLTASLTRMRELLGPDDAFVKSVLGKQSPRQVATRVIDGTRLGDIALRQALWQGGAAAVAASQDPMIQLARQIDPAARAVRQRYEQDVEAVEQKNAELIAQARLPNWAAACIPTPPSRCACLMAR
ncbi:Peptidase S46 [Amantichitinum ursilacus]|uniref:Dipeptidyl-peptidase n=1 Tax=Amantichitinum ursilacus TaxID=857265 RepID=A0A0N0GPJ9_9NEIS|nr:Peptidase S46 [Amantichitinum ursilacus]